MITTDLMKQNSVRLLKLTTPNKEQILERATELYFKENPHMQNTPEPEELVEDGYFFQAQHELMATPYKQFEPDKPQKPETPFNIYDFNLDIPLLEKSNLLISGCNSSGKTRLGAMICSMLKTFDWQIIVFDNSSVWKQVSDIAFYYDLNTCEDLANIPLTEHSIIYDFSELNIDAQRFIVNLISNRIWRQRTPYENRNMLIVLEEFELYGRNLRGFISQNIFRIMHSGRNKHIRVLAITTDLALIDTSFIRLCQQRFHGKLGIEENSKRKFKHYYGNEYLEICEKLEIGNFLYLHNDSLKVIHADLFNPKTAPQPFMTMQPKKTSWLSRILGM